MAVAEQRLQRTATEQEIAEQLKLTLEEFHGWLVEIRWPGPGESGKSPEEGGRDRLVHFRRRGQLALPDRGRAGAGEPLGRRIEKMPEIERMVLSLYYREELTLREIAKVVQLHESRISQLKTQAILRLRGYMIKRWPVERGAAWIPQGVPAEDRALGCRELGRAPCRKYRKHDG